LFVATNNYLINTNNHFLIFKFKLKMSGLSPQKLRELKLFLEHVKTKPQLFHLKELEFF